MLTVDKVEDVLQEIVKNMDGVTSILVGTLGSILDEEEVSIEFLSQLCSGLHKIDIHTVIFETHYTTVNHKVCRWLRELLPDKDIVIEIGLESADDLVLKKCLNKKIDIEALKTTIQQVHEDGCSITANVFLGAPFLSPREQIEDTIKTIRWSIVNSVDSIVIFPANIRRGTLLERLYKEKKYEQVMNWQVLEVLKNVPLHYLDRVYLSWYGDWIDYDADGVPENIPPYSCPVCAAQWQEFYRQFLSNSTAEKRKTLIDHFNAQAFDCICYHRFRSLFQSDSSR